MQVKTSAPDRNLERYNLILLLRNQGKSHRDISRILKVSRQLVYYYLSRYGDIDKFEK